METIKINPANESIKIMADALKIKNEFVGMGFKGVYSLCLILKLSFPDVYKKYNEKDILGYWNLRIRNEEMNNDFLNVIEALKAE